MASFDPSLLTCVSWPLWGWRDANWFLAVHVFGDTILNAHDAAWWHDTTVSSVGTTCIAIKSVRSSVSEGRSDADDEAVKKWSWLSRSPSQFQLPASESSVDGNIYSHRFLSSCVTVRIYTHQDSNRCPNRQYEQTRVNKPSKSHGKQERCEKKGMDLGGLRLQLIPNECVESKSLQKNSIKRQLRREKMNDVGNWLDAHPNNLQGRTNAGLSQPHGDGRLEMSTNAAAMQSPTNPKSAEIYRTTTSTIIIVSTILRMHDSAGPFRGGKCW